MTALKWITKCILAGITAFAILCFIFACYVFTPVHTENPNGNTDYIWPANTLWFKMTEGISWGRFDANGYNNFQVVDNPDILILGSSHMEATDVPQDRNTAHYLAQELDNAYTVYNMGISGHNFPKVCSLLSKNLELYQKAPKYIVIETSSVNITPNYADALIHGTVDFIPSNDKGIVAVIQRLPFARLAYLQIKDGLLDLFQPEKDVSPNGAPSPATPIADAYDRYFSHVYSSVKDADTQLIIVYHPTEQFMEDGSITFDTNPERTQLFAAQCEKYGFIFLDMTEPFTRMYEEEHLVPHGFITGLIGSGHLNADGHRAIASALSETILELEKEG